MRDGGEEWPVRQESDDARNARLRALPQLQRLLEFPAADALARQFSRPALVHALRLLLAEARAGSEAPPPDPGAILDRAARHLQSETRPALRRVINATGIALHTNLGRAPLAQAAAEAVAAIAAGYCNLEFDLESGERGARLGAVERLLTTLTGAEAALAVNNNAAAVLLALSGLASDGEVIVSRGELVEIGGGFRIPDVIRQGGARLVEVGTTNKTRLADYAEAITPATRVLLKVHQSNYRIVGFTEETALAELAPLARAHGISLIDDLGSGRLHGPAAGTVSAAIAQGADLVTFSGDKLLGGPQSGLLAGSQSVIARLARHPLMRALRLDKLTLAALEATLRLHLDPDRATRLVPAARMLAQTEAELRARAERLAGQLNGLDARIESSLAHAGGGSLPGKTIPSHALSIAIPGLGATALARRLRRADPAIAGRIVHDRVLLDMFAVADTELDDIARVLREIAG